MVIVYGVAAHHVRYEMSTVAWRAASGLWTVETTGESLFIGPSPPGPGPGPVPQTVPLKSRTLTAEEATRLDTLLADGGLYREADKFATDAPAIGGFSFDMEVISPSGRRRARWFGRLEGKAGAVADEVIGRG